MDKSAIRRSDFAGQELTMYLQKLLCDNGYPLTRRDDVVRIQNSFLQRGMREENDDDV